MAFILKLRILTGKHSGREIEVSRSKFVIGRADDCDLRPASPEVSRRHCAFLIEAHGIALQDLGSSVGTLVDGVALSGRRLLKGGERVKVGPLLFEVRVALDRVAMDAAPASATPAKPSDSSTTVVAPQAHAADTAARDAAAAKRAAQADDDVLQWLTDAPTKPRPRYMKLEPPPAQAPAGDTGQVSLDATLPMEFLDVSPPSTSRAAHGVQRQEKLDPATPDPKASSNTGDAAAAAIDKFRTTNPTIRRAPPPA